jgi:hypothetical protein
MAGFDATCGIKKESSYGTAVVVDRWLELSKESIQGDYARVESDGIRSGSRARRANRFVPWVKAAKGDLEIDLLSAGHGLLLEAMLGSVTSSGPSDSAYTYTAVPGSLHGKSWTMQIGRPDLNDVIYAFTYNGGKIDSWELSSKPDELLSLKSTWDFAGESAGTAATGAGATARQLPTWTRTDNAELLSFLGGTVQIDSGPVQLTDLTIKVDNGLKTDRFVLATPVRAEPVQNDFLKVEIDATMEFDTMAHLNKVVATTPAGTLASLTASWQAPTSIGAGATKPSLSVSVPCLRWDGDMPNVDGPKALELKLKGVGLWDGTHDVISLAYVTGDSTA